MKQIMREGGVTALEVTVPMVEITYHLAARPTFRVPDVVARSLFHRAVSGLLVEVEAEILRRAEGSPRAGAPGAEVLEARR